MKKRARHQKIGRELAEDAGKVLSKELEEQLQRGSAPRHVRH